MASLVIGLNQMFFMHWYECSETTQINEPNFAIELARAPFGTPQLPSVWVCVR